MEIFERQQIAESIKAVVKARWFFASTVFVSGLIIKLFIPTVPLAATWQLTLILIASYLYNISYWLYTRRPPEKMSEFGLNLVKGLQIPIDALVISAILYFSGTVDKLVVVWYFVTLMIGIALYGKKGIIFSAFVCSFLYSGVALLEYYGFFTFPAGATGFVPIRGNLTVLSGRLIGFNFYIIAAAFFAWFIGNLFRIREKRLIGQKDELTTKAQLLTTQTQELTQTKDWLHEALTKSDKARVELSETKQELEKANLELTARIKELETYSKVTVGREIRMSELKQKIKALEERVKELSEQKL